MPKHGLSFSPVFAMLVAAAIAVGCASDADDDEAIVEQQVDPRFVSAESLLKYFNSLNTQLPPDLPNLAPLYYVENDFQRKVHDSMTRNVSSQFFQLDKAMYNRFGESYMDDARARLHKPRLKACTAAVLSKIEPRRAEGTYVDHFGKSVPLHLVEFNGRWWLSAYTIEYQINPDYRDFVEAITDATKDLNANMDYLQPVVDGIRNGQYANAAAARKAVLEVMFADFRARRGQ